MARHKAIGSTRSTDSNLKGHQLRASSGGGMTFTRAAGLGKSMVSDLDSVISRAKAQYKAESEAIEKAARDKNKRDQKIDEKVEEIKKRIEEKKRQDLEDLKRDIDADKVLQDLGIDKK